MSIHIIYCCVTTDVRGIMNRKHVQEGHNQVKTALHDYTAVNYPQIQVCTSYNYYFKTSAAH